MLRFAADENFNNDILDGLLRRKPELDVLRVQDTDLLGAEDPAVLAWADKVGRVGPVIEDLLFLAECSRDGEWEGQVLYLPLR